MIENLNQAIEAVSKQHNISIKEILEKEIVLEYEVEDDFDEFSRWFKNGKQLQAGTPIGYSVTLDGKESYIFQYNGLVEE